MTRMRSGRYQARYVGPDDVRHTAGMTFSAKIDADAWLAAERRLVETNTWTPPEVRRQRSKALTFGEYADRWLSDRDELKPRTVAHYRALLDRLILPTFGDLEMTYISSELINSWHKQIGPDRPTLRSHAYSLLSSILRSASRGDRPLIPVNPCAVERGTVARRKHRVKPLTAPQITQLVEAMPERYRVMTLLAAWCALRFGELAALRRSDLDLTNGVIRVRRGVVRVDGQMIEGSPKTEAGSRDVLIPAPLVPVIREHIAQYVSGRNALLFPAADGVSFLQPSTLYGKNPDPKPGKGRAVKPRYPNGTNFYGARAAIGRPDLHWHDLRHTGAVLAAQTGATIADLMGRLGHTTHAAAMRYQHMADEGQQKISAGLGAMMGETR